MMEVLTANKELALLRRAEQCCISQPFTCQDFADLANCSFTKIPGERVIDGKKCCVVRGTFEPAIGSVINDVFMSFEKATMLLLKAQISGEYGGMPFLQTSTYSYKFHNEVRYPLKVKKECKLTETKTRTTTMLGEVRTQTRSQNYRYVVEGIEKITVPAGTFRCFRIVYYDDLGNAFKTRWESSNVKHFEIKMIDHKTGEVVELSTKCQD